MAAGLGFKDFVTGEVLTAADVDGYLMQGVWVFASAAARDAAVTSPQEGNFAYLKDTNVTTYYTGSAWANLDTTGMTNPMTTTGDIIYSSPGSTPVRLGIGTANQVLKVNSGATAPEWGTPAAGGGMTLISETTASGLSSLDLSSIPGTYKDLLLVFSGIYHSDSSSGFILRFNADSGDVYKTHIGKIRSDSAVREENTSFTNADTDQPMFAGGMDGGSNLLKSCVGTLRITNYASTTKLKYYQAQYAQDTNLDYVIVLHGIYNSTSAITSLNWTRSTGSGTFSNETNTSILLYGVS